MSLFTPKEYVAPQGSGSKVFSPGQVYATIADVKLDFPTWAKNNGGLILLTLEGPAIEGFEGFARDRNDPGLGNFEGQTANVKSGNWPMADWTPPTGAFRSRDEQLKDFLDMLLTNMGKMDAVLADFAKKSPKLDTIEDYALYAKDFLVDRNNFGYFTIIGEPYTNDKGKESMTFYFPRKGKDFPTLKGDSPVYKATKEGEIPANLFSLPTQADYTKARSGGVSAASAAAPAATPVQGFGGAAAGSNDDNDLPF